MRWTQAPSAPDWEAALAALRSGTADRPVLLLAHVTPDADALGSALAVGLALEQLGFSVQVSYGDTPFVLARVLQFLPGQHLLVLPGDISADPAAVVTFDVSSVERLGVLQQVAEAAQTLVVIDHHTSYTGFGGVHVVDVSSPATAVLALDLVDRLGADLTPDIATLLYAGLITDTGSFRYAATTPSTHSVAARLLGTGIAHDVIARRIYDDEPFGALRLLGVALGRAVLEQDAANGLGLVWTLITQADRAVYDLPMDTTERVIDVLRIANEAEIATVLKQDDTGQWRVSMRSKGKVDVSSVALALGGGGHRFAAGYTGHGSPTDVMDELRVVLDGTSIN